MSAPGTARDDLSALTDSARQVLDVDLGTADTASSEDLGRLWDLVTSEILRDDAGAPDRRLPELVGLLDRIRATETEMTRRRMREHSRAFANVGSALAELSGTRDVDSLLAQAPEAACRLGFDRALVSTVDGTWRLHSMCVVRDQRWAEEIVGVGREDPPLLNPMLVETDSVEGVRTTLVHEVQENPRVNRPLAEITRSSSYGIAPLLVDGEVIGLLHGDFYHQRRTLTSDDQALLSAFAAGLSQNLARVTMLEGMAAVRERLDGIGHWRPASTAAASVAAARRDHPVLTRREAQIMRLMANGDANAKIARRLVISEATVKSHITHILRKLDAANRAEAVAVWLRSENDRPRD
ncbi:MAG: LuxR C-terminal-related transcriptional regulator [Gordonia sp. (in: high G+C Gram-positive bacteria)]|uniref:LuxR C-terminal-related transcriptional regulator n=1 Tax=Gordonia sp. (in: high G+C Gram-positive bacteria) TaxID=84139 RepID=UPI0039E59C24